MVRVSSETCTSPGARAVAPQPASPHRLTSRSASAGDPGVVSAMSSGRGSRTSCPADATSSHSAAMRSPREASGCGSPSASSAAQLTKISARTSRSPLSARASRAHPPSSALSRSSGHQGGADDAHGAVTTSQSSSLTRACNVVRVPLAMVRRQPPSAARSSCWAATRRARSMARQRSLGGCMTGFR